MLELITAKFQACKIVIKSESEITVVLPKSVKRGAYRFTNTLVINTDGLVIGYNNNRAKRSLTKVHEQRLATLEEALDFVLDSM